jgi:hypothetical protein
MKIVLVIIMSAFCGKFLTHALELVAENKRNDPSPPSDFFLIAGLASVCIILICGLIFLISYIG